MADSKNHIARNLESAKVWIDQAGQSFDKNSDVRGELNLLLAQAELQRVRELNQSRHSRWKYPFLRHGVAFFLAVTVAVSGFVWWQGQRDPVAPLPQVSTQHSVQLQPSQPMADLAAGGQPQPVNKQTIVPTPSVQVSTAEKKEEAKPQPTEAAARPEPVRTKSDSDVRLAPDELQQLIRAAGKSLRGQ